MAGSTARGGKTDPAPPEGDEDDGILRLGEGEPAEQRWVVFFRAGGKAYEGLANPDGKMLLRYTHIARKRGGDVATSWLLEQMLKPDAYAVLHDDPKIGIADVRKIIDKCEGLLYGKRPAAPKAKS